MDEITRNKLLINHFSTYLTDHRKEVVEQVLNFRTRHITLVLEEIYQPHNASAVIRTCECMGIQDIHFIENEVKYEVNKRVLKGSHKWIDLIKYKEKNAVATCFNHLKSQGYKILVTDPSPDGVSIHDVPIDNKIALVMGNELHGTSAFALSQADMKVHIPMYGFTESLNISVSAAMCLNTLIPKLHKSEVGWQLSETEKEDIRFRWIRKMMKRPEIMEREFLKSIE
ncbi:MAG: RNA methyltransferase [Flammeovirgaceae bacterium]|nr:RNA methyltransferase [Flammeovirgaceae bacterium]